MESARPFRSLLWVGIAILTWGAPASAQDFLRGDIDGDGHLFLADPIILFNQLFGDSTGFCARPTGSDAADVNDDGAVDISDVSFVKGYLFCPRHQMIPAPGSTTPGPDPTPDGLTCPYVPVLPSEGARQAALVFGFDPCPIIFGVNATLTVYATITTPTDGIAGWSLSIGAENLHIVSITTAGTEAAESTDNPPGLRSGGSAESQVVDPNLDLGSGPQGQGAVSGVLLSLNNCVPALAVGTHRVAAITVAPILVDGHIVPGGRLFFADGKKGKGLPVINVATVNGQSHYPKLGSCSVGIGDCNQNGIPDDEDVAAGTSKDCNGNLVPDECEPDCNTNGLPDSCDIAQGTSRDCNGNGVPDSCDLAAGTALDCNGNGIPDSCDIAIGTSKDCNRNGIPDSCDIASGFSKDSNENGVPDSCEPVPDCNLNGIQDTREIQSALIGDCNGNGIPDSCDIASGLSEDCDKNGVPDSCEADCNGNGRTDACDIASGSSRDENGDGVPDECLACPELPAADCVPGQGIFIRFRLRGSCSESGKPGSVLEQTVFAQIETKCWEPGDRGIEFWSLGISSTNCKIKAATRWGTLAAPKAAGGLFDNIDSLGRFHVIDPAFNNGKNGVIGYVLLSQTFSSFIPPVDGSQDVLRLTVEGTIPESGCVDCVLQFEDGLKGLGQPVTNFANYNGRSLTPILTEMHIQFCAKTPGGTQRPGDCNQDGRLDLSDTIWLLGHLFLGTQPTLPCEGGTSANPGPGELALVDVNGDGGIDLSDAVSIISFLFLGSKPPSLGTVCVPIIGCKDNSAKCGP